MQGCCWLVVIKAVRLSSRWSESFAEWLMDTSGLTVRLIAVFEQTGDRVKAAALRYRLDQRSSGGR